MIHSINASANPKGVYTMEKDTFTLSEIMGISFWEATWPMLIIWALVLLYAFGDLLIAIYRANKAQK